MPRLAEAGRLAAGALLLAAVGLAYLVGVHWWWTVPQLRMHAEIESLLEQEQRLRMHAAQGAEVEQALVTLRARQTGRPGFLAEPSEQLATAALVQQLENVVRGVGTLDTCQLAGTTPQPSRVRERYARVVVQVRLRCDTDSLVSILDHLEGSTPELFVDDLGIRGFRTASPVEGGGADALDVGFDLYGYLDLRGDGA